MKEKEKLEMGKAYLESLKDKKERALFSIKCGKLENGLYSLLIDARDISIGERKEIIHLWYMQGFTHYISYYGYALIHDNLAYIKECDLFLKKRREEYIENFIKR